jgi:hypothetical protein
MGGPAGIHRVVDVPEIDAHKNGPRPDEKVDGSFGKKRSGLPVALCPPSFVPSCTDEYGSSHEFGGRLTQDNGPIRLHLPIQNDSGNSGNSIERNLAEVRSVAVTVKRAIEICPDVADHGYLSEIELGLIMVPGSRGLVVQKGTNLRPRKAWVGRHSVFDEMVHFNELRHPILLSWA